MDWYHKVLASNRSAKDLMEFMREEKEQLEQELEAIKSVSSRREADRRAEVREFTTWMSACVLLDTRYINMTAYEDCLKI